MITRTERSSRLGLTCANATLLRSRPQAGHGQPTRREAPYAIARTFPRKRGGASALALACGSRAARPGPYVKMILTET
jgi:hypothetical protein